MRAIATFIFFLAAIAGAQDDRSLDFLRNHTDYAGLREQLANLEKARAFALLDAREARVSKWTVADAKERRAYLREKMTRALGGFPERTPLNAKVTGTIDHPEYRIEK